MFNIILSKMEIQLSGIDIIVLVRIKHQNLTTLPYGFTEAQFVASVKKMNGKYVRAAFNEGEGLASLNFAYITEEGEAVLDVCNQEINKEVRKGLSKEGFMPDEIEVLMFYADGYEHFEYPENVADFDEVIDELAHRGYIHIAKTSDNGDKLSRKGKQLIFKYINKYQRMKNNEEQINLFCKHTEELERLEENEFRKKYPSRTIDVYNPNFTELQSKLLNMLLTSKGKIADIETIQCIEPFIYCTNLDISIACVELRDNDMISAYIDGYNLEEGPVVSKISITDKGRIALKNNKNSIELSSSNLRIKEKCKTDIIKIFYGIQKCGLIEKEDGTKATIQDVMDVAAQMFNDESLKGKRYSSLLSEAADNDKVTFLSVFNDLSHYLEIYYNKHKEGK